MRSETFALKSLSIVSTDMATLPIRGAPWVPRGSSDAQSCIKHSMAPLNPWVLEFKVTRDESLGNALDASGGLGMNVHPCLAMLRQIPLPGQEGLRQV